MALNNSGNNVQYVTELHPHDVLFGRGSGPNDHEGNVRFRQYVADRKAAYMATNHRATKTNIAREIVGLVVQQHGRFLKKIENGGTEGPDCYEVVDDDTIMEKAKQALRQNAAKVRGDQQAVAKPAKSSPLSHGAGGGGGYPQNIPVVQQQQQQQQPNTVYGNVDPIPYQQQQQRPTRSYERQPAPVQSYNHMQLPQRHASIEPTPIWEAGDVNNRVTVVSGDGHQLQEHQPYADPVGSINLQGINAAGIIMNNNAEPFQANPQGTVLGGGSGHHRHVVSEPPSVQQSVQSNFSMAELPTGEDSINFQNSRRTSMTIQEVFKHGESLRLASSSNNPALEKVGSMEDLMDSFNQMKPPGGGVLSEADQRRMMMASTDTMGTIEGINAGSVADMSLATMNSSTFSLFGKGNESMSGGFHDTSHTSSGSGSSQKSGSKPSALDIPSSSISTTAVSSKDPALLGSSLTGSGRSGGSSGSKMALDNSSLLFATSGDSAMFKSSGSINGAIEAVRRQVESEYPSLTTLPQQSDSTLMKSSITTMGDSSLLSNSNHTFAAGASPLSTAPSPAHGLQQTSNATLQEQHHQQSQQQQPYKYHHRGDNV